MKENKLIMISIFEVNEHLKKNWDKYALGAVSALAAAKALHHGHDEYLSKSEFNDDAIKKHHVKDLLKIVDDHLDDKEKAEARQEEYRFKKPFSYNNPNRKPSAFSYDELKKNPFTDNN